MTNADLQEATRALDREILAVQDKLVTLHTQVLFIKSTAEKVKSDDPFTTDYGMPPEDLQQRAILLIRKSGSLAMAASGLYKTAESFLAIIPGARGNLTDHEYDTLFSSIGHGVRRFFRILWMSRKILFS
jgi:hypothetical protein